MSKDNKGFSLVESLLILVIIGVLSFVGWYVLHSKNSTDNIYNKAAGQGAAASTARTSGTPKLETWQQMPSDLQKAITAVWQRDAASCIANGAGPDKQLANTAVTAVLDDSMANTPVGCGSGGGFYLFVNSGGKWQDVEHTSLAYTCATIQKYGVPKSLLTLAFGGGTSYACLKADGTTQAL